MNSDRIYMNDLTQLYCVPGIRRAFERAGVDIRSFIENGATESELRGKGCDAMLNRAIRRKQEATNEFRG